MGTYVNIEDADCVIPADNVVEALLRLNEFIAKISNLPRRIEERTSLVELLEEGLRFEVDIDNPTGEAGNEGIRITGYNSKTRVEQAALAVIGDLITEHSYIVWRDENGGTWRTDFEGEIGMLVSEGIVTWGTPTPVTVEWQNDTNYVYPLVVSTADGRIV